MGMYDTLVPDTVILWS